MPLPQRLVASPVPKNSVAALMHRLVTWAINSSRLAQAKGMIHRLVPLPVRNRRITIRSTLDLTALSRAA